MLSKKQRGNIKVTGRAGLEYTINGKTVLIDSEMLAGPRFDMVVYTDSVKQWCPPNDKQALSENEKKMIIDDIKVQLKNLKIDWQ